VKVEFDHWMTDRFGVSKVELFKQGEEIIVLRAGEGRFYESSFVTVF